MHISPCANGSRHPRHDEGYGEESDDGTACRQGDGECHIASGEHRKHIARTAARAAGNEHDAEEKESFEVENISYCPSDERQEDDLSDDTCKHRQGTLENQLEIMGTQRESEVEHQQRQNG